MIKIKEEDSNAQTSDGKSSSLETNKKLLLERIINQKRDTKISSRGNSQNPSTLERESEGITLNEDSGLNS